MHFLKFITLRKLHARSSLNSILKICESSARALFLYGCTPNTLHMLELQFQCLSSALILRVTLDVSKSQPACIILSKVWKIMQLLIYKCKIIVWWNAVKQVNFTTIFFFAWIGNWEISTLNWMYNSNSTETIEWWSAHPLDDPYTAKLYQQSPFCTVTTWRLLQWHCSHCYLVPGVVTTE